MSAKCQKRTFRHSFDHLVGACEQRRRHGEAKRLGGFEVDDQLELSWTARTGRSAGFSPLRIRPV